jgi:hypothetical protein
MRFLAKNYFFKMKILMLSHIDFWIAISAKDGKNFDLKGTFWAF